MPEVLRTQKERSQLFSKVGYMASSFNSEGVEVSVLLSLYLIIGFPYPTLKITLLARRSSLLTQELASRLPDSKLIFSRLQSYMFRQGVGCSEKNIRGKESKGKARIFRTLSLMAFPYTRNLQPDKKAFPENFSVY